MPEATTAPATAPAPAAPAKPVTPPANGATPAEAAPVETVNPFAEALKKTPLKYKANGKEVEVKDYAALERKLQQLDGIEAAREAAAKDRQEAEAVRQAISRLRTDNPAELEQALTSIFGDEAKAMAVVEKMLLGKYEAAERLKKMDPETRRLAEEHERLQREAEALKAEKMQREQAEAEAKFQRDMSEARDALSAATLAILKASGTPQATAPFVMRLALPIMARALRDGRSLESAQAEATEAALSFTDELFLAYVQAGPSVFDRFGEAGKGFVKAMRKRDLEELAKSQGLVRPPPAPVEEKKPEETGSKRGRWDVIDKMLGH